MKHGIRAGLSDYVQNAAAGSLHQAVQIASVSGRPIERTRIVQRTGERLSSVVSRYERVQHLEISGRVQPENHTALAGGVTAALSDAADVAVHITNQSSRGTAAIGAAGEGVKNAEVVGAVELEYSSEIAGAGDGHTIDVPVRIANQARGFEAVGCAGEAVQNCFFAALGDFEDGSTAARAAAACVAAELRGAVEHAIDRDQAAAGLRSVGASLEGVQRGELVAGIQFEDCAAGATSRTAFGGRSVKVAGRVAEQGALGKIAVGFSGEGIQNRLVAGVVEFENRSTVVGAAVRGAAIKVSTGILDQTSERIRSVTGLPREAVNHGVGLRFRGVCCHNGQQGEDDDEGDGTSG